MKKLDLVLAWALVVVGVVFFASRIVALGIMASSPTLWLLASGTVFAQCGFLNVLRNEEPRGTARILSIFSNVVMVLVVAGLVILEALHGRLLHSTLLMIMFVLVVAETMFSIA